MSIFELFKTKSLGRAVGESILIMFGVLAALAVQSWWDGKVERDVLLSHLTAVQDELHEAQASIVENLRQTGLTVDRTHSVLTMLADTQTEAMPDSFMEIVGDMYSIHGPGIPLSAYDAFVGSGSLRLVKDKALRAKFAEYRNAIGNVQNVNRALWSVYYELQVPFLNKFFVLSEFGWTIKREDAFGDRIGSSGEIPKARRAANWEGINTLEFWNLVYSWRIAYGDQISGVIRVQGLCQQLDNLLQAEIARLRR
jgi:hypothetical protein